MSGNNWQCPFCGRHTTITAERQSFGQHRITIDNKFGRQVLKTAAIACPNEACKDLFLVASLSAYSVANLPGGPKTVDKEPHTRWTLRPQANVKVFPDYIPAPIMSDYREACLIRDLSAKASATLSRRCLQGMIRDFWDVRKDKLFDEIKALEGKVDEKTWQAIDAIRKLGNIGAHMEKDINLIVDVDPQEAGLLIELVETLLEDWYVERHARLARMDRIISTAASKKAISPVGSTTATIEAPPVPEGGATE